MSADQQSSTGTRKVHPLVYIDYRIRVPANLMLAATLSTVLYDRHTSLLVWGALAFHALVWPHLAFLNARHGRNTKNAELTNLLIDAFVDGGWIAVVSFSPWPTAMIVSALTVAFLSVAGIRFTLVALATLAAGALVTTAVAGFRFEPQASVATVALSFTGFILYATVFGLVTNRQARRIVQSNKTIERQKRELGEALEHQTAISAVAGAISQAPTDAQPVLETVAAHLARLFAAGTTVFLLDGDRLRPVAAAGGGVATRPDESIPLTPDSLAARAVLERRSIEVTDAVAVDGADRPPGAKATRQAVPLLREGRPLGAILIERRADDSFSARQAELLKTFADQAAIALDSARLFAELQERTRELARSLEEVRALSEVTQAASSSLDLGNVLAAVIRHAVKLAGADAGAIFQFDPNTRSFAAVASDNLGPEFLERIRTTPIDPTTGVIRRATETGQPFQIPDVAGAAGFVFRDTTLREGFQAMLSAPIPGHNITRGVTVFRRAPGRFEPRIVELLVALANQSKVAIENAHLFEEVHTQRVELERLSQNLENLYRLSTAMQEPLSLREQLRRVLEAASRMGIIDRINVWAVTAEADRLVSLAGAGFADDEWKDVEGTEIPLAQAGAMYKAYRDGTPLVFDDSHPLPPELRLPPPYGHLKGIQSRRFLVVPMIARGVTVGVLAGDNKPSGRAIDPPTVALLQTFASHAAIAIANARLFQAIEDKSHQLEAATNAKSEFLANMSHELRTPLNAIIGFSEVLLERMFGDLNDRQEDYLTDIRESGRHLLSLINDILDLSKVEAGRMELQLAEVDVAQAIETAVMLIRERGVRRGIAFHVEADPRLGPVSADERKIKQVLLNLLSNAVKFTPEGGDVTVRATLADGAVEVSVADTGIGIAPEDQEAVFEEFRQVGGSDAGRQEGTGLGLTLARKFVELHGGRIWVASRVGQGSTFTFTIPMTEPARR